MKLPEIGEIVTTSRALELCRHFALDYLAARIEAAPEKFKDWKFDGVSCFPDEAHAFFAGVRIGGAEAFGLSFSWGFARKG